MTKTTLAAHFVLVHGAYHGAWCWYKIRCLLECAGHKVTCLDLRSAGIDPSDPNTIFKFEEYNQPLDDVLSGLGEGEKVILVGHSSGGLNITAAIHRYPEKIKAAVYVVGEMRRNGAKVPPDAHIDTKIFDVYYGEGPDRPPTSFIYKKELIRHHFYQRSPLEDYTLAAMLLRPVPFRATADAEFPDEPGKDIDKVPRVYIKTLDDNAISQEGQDALINDWPPSDVFTIDSDHSPFFSNPFQLFGLLLKVATKYGGCQHKNWGEQCPLMVVDGSSSHGSPATETEVHCPNCTRPNGVVYDVSTFVKNILGPCHGCSNHGGLVSWVEEDGKGSRGSQHSPLDNVRNIRQKTYGGGTHGDDVLINLKEEMISMANDVRQMREKMKTMLQRNFDASRVVIVLCLCILLIVVIVMAMKNWGSMIGEFGCFRDIFWI